MHKTSKKKLAFRSETIMRLNETSLENVRGGATAWAKCTYIDSGCSTQTTSKCGARATNTCATNLCI